MSSSKKSKERRIRFVPGQGSEVFARSRPFHVILKDTGDPRIKKLQLEDAPDTDGDQIVVNLPADLRQRLRSDAAREGLSVSARIEALLRGHYEGNSEAESPIDLVFLNIIEAADLTLDAADPEQQHEILDVVRHSFRALIELRGAGDLSKPSSQARLRQILGDLDRLRAIADQEIARGEQPPA